MRLVRRSLTLLATALVTLGVLAIGSPASALSCIGPGSIAPRAPAIFTGRIIDAEDKRLLVQVHEIWKGDPGASPIWLDTDPTLDGWWDPLPGKTIPDGYSSKLLWLFMPDVDSGTPRVSPCSAWPLAGKWKIDYPRPTTARMPAATEQPVPTAIATKPALARSDDKTWMLVTGATTALVAGAAGYLVVRRRRQSAE